MDIERQHLKSVVFLCIEKKDHAGKVVREPVSTGFLVRVPDPLHGGEWDYLVTARHCIEEPAQQLFIRANTTTGFTDWPTSKDDWFTHDDADVAASVFQPDEPVAVETVPLSIAVRNYIVPAPPELPADSQLRPFFDMGAIKVRIGNEVFFTGLFVESAGEHRTLPIVRFGHISRMPEELISFHTQARGDIKLPLYLTECHSWGGHSGSPAYWYNEVKLGDMVKIDGKTHQVVVGQYYVVGLLGLVTGHFDSTQLLSFA